MYANEMLMREEACLEGSSKRCWRGVRVEGGALVGLQGGYGVFMAGSWRGASWWASLWHLGGFVVASRGASWWPHSIFMVGSWGRFHGGVMVASWWHLGGLHGGFWGSSWGLCGGIVVASWESFMVASWWLHVGTVVTSW